VSVEAGLVETYRGGVAAWECDAFGHLNIAFYVDRFADAAADLLERHAPGRRWRTLALDTVYERELRAGEGLAIRSGLLEVHLDRVRIAHELVESAGGTRATVAEHVLAAEPGPVTELASAPAFAWQRLPLFAWPAGEGRIASGRDRARPAEIEAGRLAPLACLHRFSNACLHVIDAIGMTHAYRESAQRGFATFETRLAIDDSSASAGEGLVTTSGVVSVGRSSLAMLHRLHATGDGRSLARFYQAGVHFDLAARRSTLWPTALHDKAETLKIHET
jgi:acyl-CoA thioesterase FadM